MNTPTAVAPDSSLRAVMNSLGLLILRLGIGGFMMTHGWPKAQSLFAGDFEKFGDPIGLGSGASLVLAATGEFLCAALVMLGFLTRFAAVGPVMTMAVAAFVIHQNDPWTMGAGASKEPALLYLIPFLALIFTGPGRISLDALIWGRSRKR